MQNSQNRKSARRPSPIRILNKKGSRKVGPDTYPYTPNAPLKASILTCGATDKFGRAIGRRAPAIEKGGNEDSDDDMESSEEGNDLLFVDALLKAAEVCQR